MKSAHRHQLETNALAQRLDVLIERLRPYAATVAGVIVVLVLVMFVWSYVSGSSAARQGAAWDAYHTAIGRVPPDLAKLRQTAEAYPETKMQQLADVTWADGQVWAASRDYFHNRDTAMEALRRATSTYQGILQTSDDQRLLNRAHLGLARVYEMQNELDKANQEYLKVTGGFQEFAQQQAERVASPEAKDAYAWLATAQAPRPKVPAGPGTPGQRPEFSAGDFPLPGESPDADATGGPPAQEESFEKLLKDFDLGFPKADETDRYKAGQEQPATDGAAANSDAAAAPTDTQQPNNEPSEPATNEKPAE
jgi:hypothetical protein